MIKWSMVNGQYSSLDVLRSMFNIHWSIVIIVCCLPFILWAVCGIMPTFDDFTSLQSTWYIQISDPGYFFPDAIRRPWDFLFGCLLGWQPALFPTLNHIAIILGHTASTFLLYAICRKLNLQTIAANIATLFFFFSPATLGATLACDGLNQTYAQFWGLLALWTYLSNSNSSRSSYVVQRSTLFVLMAALSKENGLAWAVVLPTIAYAFRLINRRKALHDFACGIVLAIGYVIFFFAIYKSGIFHVEYDEAYSQATIGNHLKDFVQLVAYNFIPLDYMSAVYPPTRNWTIVAVTALMALPFLTLLVHSIFNGQRSMINGQRSMVNGQWSMINGQWSMFFLLLLSFFFLAAPHLLTVTSIMHNYAPLAITAIIIAFIIQNAINKPQRSTFNVPLGQIATKGTHKWIIFFALFMAAALFTDIHHYIAARESGNLGKQLAMQAIEHADKPIERAMVISIDDPDEPRYSSFCVRPVNAFAWGLAVRHYSHYSWKTVITEAKLTHYDALTAEALADSALQSGNEAVWIVGHKSDSLTIISNSYNNAQ